MTPPGLVDEDSAHRLGCRREEMRAVAPVGLMIASEAHPGLVHEGGGLERLTGWLARHLGGREAAQLVIDEWEDAFGRARVAARQILQQQGDFPRWSRRIRGTAVCRACVGHGSRMASQACPLAGRPGFSGRGLGAARRILGRMVAAGGPKMCGESAI
jgi:hypothetical protein